MARATIGTAYRVGPLEYLAAYLITLYQRHLSPRKGFSCPHRLLHNGLSCSEYGRQAILTHGVWAAYGLTRQRLKECRAAARQLAHRSEADDEGDDETGEAEDTDNEGEVESTPVAPSPSVSHGRRRLFRMGRRAVGEGIEDALDDADAICDLTDLSCDAINCGMDNCHVPNCDMPSCDMPNCDLPNCDMPDCGGCDSCGSNVLLIAALFGLAAR